MADFLDAYCNSFFNNVFGRAVARLFYLAHEINPLYSGENKRKGVKYEVGNFNCDYYSIGHFGIFYCSVQ